jgi:hypothetical protein
VLTCKEPYKPSVRRRRLLTEQVTSADQRTEATATRIVLAENELEKMNERKNDPARKSSLPEERLHSCVVSRSPHRRADSFANLDPLMRGVVKSHRLLIRTELELVIADGRSWLESIPNPKQDRGVFFVHRMPEHD